MSPKSARLSFDARCSRILDLELTLCLRAHRLRRGVRWEPHGKESRIGDIYAGPPHMGGEALHHTPKLILIADGDARSCRTMEQRLHDARYRVDAVTSGGEVLRLCEIDPPDILILDVELVDMDGYEVCERLRHDLLCEDMTIILLTPPNDDMTRAYAAQMVDFAGGDFFLAKPYDPTVLIQLLDDLTEDPVAQSALSPPAFPTRVTWPTSRPRALVTLYSPR